jgi:hypothetical protein
MDVSSLRKQDVIPTCVEDIPTDIIEIGDVKALSAHPGIIKPFTVDKTSKVRPVPIGVSVGHWDISAGSYGMSYTRQDTPNVYYGGSNAHVLTPNPSWSPSQISEKRILQPGAYHAGKNVDNVIGNYYWHKQIIPKGQALCPVGNGASKILNSVAWIGEKLRLKGQGRFQYNAITENYIDFAAFTLLPDIILSEKIADESFDPYLPFVGHLFAGSTSTGIICKAKYILQEGFIPTVGAVAEVQNETNDQVIGCSFWCNYQNYVQDDSGNITVSYDGWDALFKDQIFMYSANVIKGGWSGSGFRKVIT